MLSRSKSAEPQRFLGCDILDPRHRDTRLQHPTPCWNAVNGGNAITKCRGFPIGFPGFEYGLWGIGFGGSPNGYDFVGYSYLEMTN